MKPQDLAEICHLRYPKRCPNRRCAHYRNRTPTRFWIRKGSFITKWNAQPVARYQCKQCGRYFSTHTWRATYGQHRPDLNETVFRLYASAMTQRRMALVLGINRKTVVRKFLFMARLARRAHRQHGAAENPKVPFAQFDEMESFEHTRLKPLSIALAVQAETGTILHARVATMPCKGPMATIALRKYGWRQDTRPRARRQTLLALKIRAAESLTLLTDCHPAYPRLIKNLLPRATHIPVKRTAAIPRIRTTDRKNPNDPLFTLNYTAAKLRHDLSRLARKVWVTTKKKERLQAHLDLYIAWNNGYRLAI